jgi:hypothetical protein
VTEVVAPVFTVVLAPRDTAIPASGLEVATPEYSATAPWKSAPADAETVMVSPLAAVFEPAR